MTYQDLESLFCRNSRKHFSFFDILFFKTAACKHNVDKDFEKNVLLFVLMREKNICTNEPFFKNLLIHCSETKIKEMDPSYVISQPTAKKEVKETFSTMLLQICCVTNLATLRIRLRWNSLQDHSLF